MASAQPLFTALQTISANDVPKLFTPSRPLVGYDFNVPHVSAALLLRPGANAHQLKQPGRKLSAQNL
jgi:hypothetical protein